MADDEKIYEIKLNLNDKKRIFPYTTNDNLNNLRITNVALYSTTPPEQSKYVCKIIRKYFNNKQLKNMTLTDVGGCIGGNTYYLSNCFEKINFIENLSIHVDIFKNNLNIVFPNKNNINIIQENYLDVYKKIQQDVIFMDPPWFGIDYYKQKSIELYYPSNGKKILLHNLVKKLSKLTSMIIIKLPINYNIEEKLFKNSKFEFNTIVPVVQYNNKIIYNLVFLSHIIPKYKINYERKFDSLGYNYMRWYKI